MSSDSVSLYFSALALIVAALSYARASAAARAQVYLDFRERFRNLKLPIPTWYDQVRVPEQATPAERRALELYWQNAFDEWFVTQRLQPRYLGTLWTRFYRGVMKGALSHGALRQVADELTGETGREFGDQKQRFREVLDKLCRETDQTRLWEAPAQARRESSSVP